MEASATLLLLVFSGVVAGPMPWRQNDNNNNNNNNMCATRCPESIKFKYQAGWSYEYQYEAETRTTLAGSAEDTARISVSASARIEVLEPCEMALRLRDVTIKRSDPDDTDRMERVLDMSEIRSALEGQPLRFAFYDGVVGDLCPGEWQGEGQGEGEVAWALNIKRGVLSSFQTSMHQMERQEQVLETDVAGRCPTHYQVTQDGWKSLTLTKVKDILACTNRQDYRTSLHSVLYNMPNSLQSLPMLKSSHECTQNIGKEDSVLQSSSCHEMHVFRPFSKANSGAVTEASHSLSFRSKTPGVRTHKGPVGGRTSLLYGHRQGMDTGSSTFMDVKNKLKEICDLTNHDIRPQAPRLFAELVGSMRNVDYSDLRDLHKQLQRNRICSDNADKTRKFFQDALPMAGTTASLRLMTDLLTSEEVSDSQASFWLTSVAFLSTPSKDMISALQPLLREGRRQQESMLAVTSLVNNYCQQQPDCPQQEEVLQVLDTLTTVLGPDCQVTQDNFQQVMLTLRAIGNIGRSEAASLRLEKCFTKSDLPMDVRVAALDAYRRMPCSADRNDVMEVFLRHSEDAELRIAAYLTVMQCPSDSVLQQVRQALFDEEVNQVGSFVWTHLTNLLETESPHKQALRDVLESELLQKEFSKDRRKFSRNTEVSYFSEKFNLGGMFENNVIWSANSFIPRSAMMNLTVDMFGHSVNLLEVGGRVQGLEYLLQTYFGADDTGKDGGYGQTDVVKNGKLVRTKANYGSVKDDLRGQLYLRVFGNELAYGMLDGSSLKKLRQGKAQAFLDDVLKKLMKDGEVSLTQSAVFLDTTITIPTVAGLPLNLTVNGSASVELQASQKMDFKKINAKSRAFEVAGMLQPSGAVEVAAAMTVDAFVTRVGLKMTSRLHSSTAMKGRVELARGQVLSVEIDTPRDTLEIFDFQSKFFVLHDLQEKEQRMVVEGRKEKNACTGEALARVAGMELCASLSFPNATSALNAPYFPFTGPTSISLTLRKHDVHSGYKLLAKQIQTSSSVITQIALDTPGSKVDRAISLGYVANLKAKTLQADLLSPWKKISAKASVESGKKVYKAGAEVTIDADQQYSLQAQVDKDIRNTKAGLMAKIKPQVQVTTPSGQVLSAKGSLDYRHKKSVKSSLLVEMNGVLKKPVSLDYTLVMREKSGKTRYKNNLKLSSQFATVKANLQALVGSFSAQRRSALLTLKSRMDYHLHAFPSIRRNVVNMGFKLNDRSTPALRKYGITMNVDAKRSPEANLLVNGEVSHKTTLTKVEMKIRRGQDVKAKANKNKELLVAAVVAHKIADPQAMVSFDFKTVYPDMAVDYQLKGKHEHNKNMMEEYLTLRYAKGKSMDAHMRLSQGKRKKSATFDLSYPAGEYYPARDVKINADLTEKNPNHHVLSALASLQKGEKHSLVVSYKRPSDSSLEISSEVGLHDHPPFKLDLAGNFALRKMKGEGKVTVEGQTYTLTYTSDIQTQERYAKFTGTFVHPERRIEALLEGGKDKQEQVKRGKVELSWDADNDPTRKIGVTVEVADKANPEDVNVGGMVEVFTPFEDNEHFKGELRFENSQRRLLTVAEVILGRAEEAQYSAKLLLSRPVTWQHLKTQVWLKTPFPELRHLEVKGDHSFDAAGSLATAVKGTFNGHTLQAGVSGRRTGDLLVRVLEGAAFFKTSLPAVGSYRLTFNHRDASGQFNTQAVLDADGDQYSAVMEAAFQKVHYQITTRGDLTLRAPQLRSPVELEWSHKNSLHELTSSLTLRLSPDQRVHLEVESTVNVVTQVYDVRGQLHGPWKENGAEHVSKLHVVYDATQSGHDLTASLQLEQDTYDFRESHTASGVAYEHSGSLRMSRYPQYSFQHTVSLQHSDFPYLLSADLKAGETFAVNLDLTVERPRSRKYQSSGRLVLTVQEAVQNVAISSSHEKNRRGQWLTQGEVEYEVGKKVAFSSLLDVEGDTKRVDLQVDTPFEEARGIRLGYSHSGNVEEDFSASCSLSVDPLFDAVSADLSWSNQDRFRGSLRVDTPFPELDYLSVKTQSWREREERHSRLEVEYAPSKLYTVDLVYSCDLPQDLDILLNISTPHRQLPSLHLHTGYRYSAPEVGGSFKLITPVLPYDELAFTFRQEQGPASFSAQYQSVIGTQNTWTSLMDASWSQDIEASFKVENNGVGRQQTQLLLSHRGQTWEDFRTRASFRMSGDRLESEVAYSNKDGRRGSFMLATPDPDINFFKTTFFQRRSEGKFEGRYTVQYGEDVEPYDLGLMTQYSSDRIAFSTDLKTPETEDLALEIGFARKRRVELKLLSMYGPDNKINILLKYDIRKELWDVGGEFEYLVRGTGRNFGLVLKRDGPLDNLALSGNGKYMGKEVEVEGHYRDDGRQAGTLQVRTNFERYTDLAAAFNHSGNSEHFQTSVYLKYTDDKEAKAAVDFQRNKWKRVTTTLTVNLPYDDYRENTLTYRHVNRRNKVSGEGSLQLGSARPITGSMDFVDKRLTVSVRGPYKDFVSFIASGTYEEAEQRLEGDASMTLTSQDRPLTATYMVRTGIWPVMVNVRAQTPFQGWENVEVTSTHDGQLTDFTSSHTVTADAVGSIQSELIWTYTSPSVLNGLWTLSSTLEGAENLKLAVKNTQSGHDYFSHLTVGWELLKELTVDTTVQLPPSDASNVYRGSLALTSPLPEVSQFSVSFDHSHDDRLIQDSVLAHFNDQKYLDADFRYDVGERRVGSVEFREPRPMEFQLGGRYTENTMEGQLKLNWDKRDPLMNIQLSGEYTDFTDQLGTDSSLKVWAIHPARTMGMEYLLKKAAKEFQSDFLLTWDKSSAQTLSYIINWTDRSSRYTSSYDAMLKVGVPMRSVQVEGVYSNAGRMKAAEGTVMWDADRDKNMKVGVKGQLDERGNTNKVQLGLDLPFVSKEYSLTTETTVNAGRTVLDTRAEFSYSVDPRKLLVVSTRIEDLAYGQQLSSNYSLTLGLVHPVTDLDLQVTSHVGLSPSASSAGTSVVYMNAQRQRQRLELRGHLDRLRRVMGVELRCPVKEMALEATVTGDNDYTIHLVSDVDGQRSKVTDVFVSPDTRTMEMTLWYDKDAGNSVKLFGHMVNDQLLQTELYRMQQGQRVSETLMTVRLNSSHVLHTRVNWRPHMLRDLQQYIGTQLTVFSYGSSEAFTAVAQAVGQEIETKYETIMTEIKEEVTPLLEHFQRELQTLHDDLESMQTHLRRFYYRNALHVQDLSSVTNAVLESMVTGMQGLVLQFRELQALMQQRLQTFVLQMGQYPMAQKYAQLVADFAGGLKNSRQMLEAALDHLSMQLSRFSDLTYRRYLLMSREIDRKLQGYTAALRQSSQYRGLSQLYGSARSGLGRLGQGNYQELAQAANARLLEALDRLGLKEAYVVIVSNAKQIVTDQFHDLVQRPEFQQMYVIGTEIYQQGVWAYHYWQVEKNTRRAVGQLLDLAKDITLLEITRVKNAVVDLDKSRVIVFDPKNGELQFEIYLPVSLKSLAEPPDLRVGKYINRVRSWAATYIPSPGHSLWSTIHNYLPNMDSATWLPPFTAHAYILGDQHVVTFDQRHYNFAGRCSYVLARDMADDRFTVVLQYNNRPRHPQVGSVLVLLRGVAIEVDRDSKVKVNNQETELPFFSGVISATRHRSVVRVQDGQALTVEVDSERGIYSVALSGWYHGRTAGLLGTYDNEPFNDLTDSNRQLSSDVEAFTNSWEVGRRYCRSRNLADEAELDPEDVEVQECQDFLSHSSSYFSPCFDQVAAEELVKVCVSMVRSGLDIEEARCKAGQQYRHLCHRLGISLSTPSQCVSCQLPGGLNLGAGETEVVEGEGGEGVQSSADVVIVVEESSCNAWVQQSLPALVTHLSQALSAKGLTDSRFGLVSYSGNGSQAVTLVHTIEGQVFGMASKFLKATENLRLTYPSQAGDAAAAVREALKYPFRVGVAKQVLLLPCASCRRGDLYPLGQVLRSHGFQLHVLQTEDFPGEDPSNASPVRVYGMDSHQAYTEKSAARRSKAIFQNLQTPAGPCQQVALSTNGSIFDASHLQSRRRIQKEFMEAFASRGAMGASPQHCEVCTCHDDGDGRGHTVCRLCSYDSVFWDHIPSWLQSSGSSVMGVFNDLHHQIVTSLGVPEVVEAA